MKPWLIALPVTGALALGVGVGTTLPHPAPQACVVAIDNAEASLKSAGEVLDITSQTMSEISSFNLRNVQSGTDRINEINPELRRTLEAFQSNKEECK